MATIVTPKSRKKPRPNPYKGSRITFRDGKPSRSESAAPNIKTGDVESTD